MQSPLILGVLLRVHDRPVTTGVILKEFGHWAAISPSELLIRPVVLADRPTAAVDALCRRALDAKTISAYHKSHRPLLDSDGDHLTESQNWQLNVLEDLCTPDWCFLCDDDRWPEPAKFYRALLPALRRDDVDAYFFESLFFYDETDTYTLSRQHYSAFLWRHTPGARFSCSRGIHVPDDLYDTALMRDRARPFGVPVLDYGTFTQADREASLKRFLAIGKDDPYTRSAVAPPDLRVFPTQYDPAYGAWVDRMKDALHGPQLSPRPRSPR